MTSEHIYITRRAKSNSYLSNVLALPNYSPSTKRGRKIRKSKILQLIILLSKRRNRLSRPTKTHVEVIYNLQTILRRMRLQIDTKMVAHVTSTMSRRIALLRKTRSNLVQFVRCVVLKPTRSSLSCARAAKARTSNRYLVVLLHLHPLTKPNRGEQRHTMHLTSARKVTKASAR